MDIFYDTLHFLSKKCRIPNSAGVFRCNMLIVIMGTLRGRVMSRSQDLVGIATGNVRVPVSTLSLGKRIRLFKALASVLQKHYMDVPSGPHFVPWQEENFGDKLSEHSVRRYSLVLDESFYPKDKNYNKETKIVALTSHYFRLPEFKLPENGQWNLGDIKLVARICLVHNGNMYLEWYIGKVTEMKENHPNLPKRVVIYDARYLAIPRFFSLDEVPDELKTLLSKASEILYSFGHACLSLLQKEEELKRRLARRDMEAFTEFSNISRIFGVTRPY